MKITLRAVVWFVLCMATVAPLAACGSAVDASRAYSRGAINSGMIAPADSVRIHEYLNHYEQRFPEPTDQAVGLDLRLGNPHIPTSGGDVWIQIGLQAGRDDAEERTPVNLALVLDVSGSMSDPQKMPYLKESLSVFLQELRPEDRVGIVAYNDEAFLLRPVDLVGSDPWIRSIIEMLEPGGSTNLHAGLMMGLAEVERTFDLRRNNRVILLTDGIANVGETDPDRIAADALAYNQRGINVSTIGLGLDMNDTLLSTLARQGHGAYHFVDSAQEMDKVFRQEVEGLIEKVASDVRVLIEVYPGGSLTMITGLDGAPPARGGEVVLQDMGAGDSQVVLALLQAQGAPHGERTLARVTLRYLDVFAQSPREAAFDLRAEFGGTSSYDPLTDIEIRRNVTIVRSAQALRTIDGLWQQGLYEQAWQEAAKMERELREVAALAGDAQMMEDADLFRRYQLTLAGALGYDPAAMDPTDQPEEAGGTPRWGIVSPPDPALPTVEVR